MNYSCLSCPYHIQCTVFIIPQHIVYRDPTIQPIVVLVLLYPVRVLCGSNFMAIFSPIVPRGTLNQWVNNITYCVQNTVFSPMRAHRTTYAIFDMPIVLWIAM